MHTLLASISEVLTLTIMVGSHRCGRGFWRWGTGGPRLREPAMGAGREQHRDGPVDHTQAGVQGVKASRAA